MLLIQKSFIIFFGMVWLIALASGEETVPSPESAALPATVVPEAATKLDSGSPLTVTEQAAPKSEPGAPPIVTEKASPKLEAGPPPVVTEEVAPNAELIPSGSMIGSGQTTETRTEDGSIIKVSTFQGHIPPHAFSGIWPPFGPAPYDLNQPVYYDQPYFPDADA